jgi:transcriptional regulator with XRE-family HTH domain
LDELTAGQIRAARGLLGWSQGDLADAAKVEREIVAAVEADDSAADAPRMENVKAALEAAGVEFIAANGGGVGVRLKRPPPPPIPGEDLNASNDE